jgi:hypothetical protein
MNVGQKNLVSSCSFDLSALDWKQTGCEDAGWSESDLIRCREVGCECGRTVEKEEVGREEGISDVCCHSPSWKNCGQKVLPRIKQGEPWQAQ